MKSWFSVPRRLAILCLPLPLLLLLAACGGAKQQYFSLSAAGTATVRNAGLGVGVGPVTLPSYIDRTELVFQSGQNQFQVPNDAYWAGSLQGNLTRVLADDLARRLNSGNVVTAPWLPNTQLSYQVTVEIGQFHAVSGGGALLDVSWEVQDPASHDILRRRNAHFDEKIEGDGYAAVVAAESRLVDQLAGAIASSLPSRE